MKKNQTKPDKKIKSVDQGLSHQKLSKFNKVAAEIRKDVAKRNLKPEIVEEAIKWARQQKKINSKEQEKIQKEEAERAAKEYWERLNGKRKSVRKNK